MKHKRFFIFAISFLILSGIVIWAINFKEPIGTQNMQTESVSGGNLVADAIRYAVAGDIAFVCTSDLKSYTAAGVNVSDSELLNFIAMKNDKVYAISITGKQITTALKKAVSVYPKNNPAFLQTSGLEVAFDPEAKYDSKIISVKLNGKSLEDDTYYLVAMSESLSNGAFGYWKIWDTSKAVINEETMGNSLIEYVKKKNIDDIYQKRIKISEDKEK